MSGLPGMWMRWTFLGLAVSAVCGFIAARLGERRWARDTDAAVASLLAHERPAHVAYSERDLRGLPPPVQRYFHRTLRNGQPLVTHARITWEGQFNMGKPGKDNWHPFTAVQDFVPGAPGFVWSARIAMLPGVPVLVRDSVVDGRASMRGAVCGVVPVVAAEGTPTLAKSALQRYLGEAAWFPTALLPCQGVSWTAIDDASALATITSGEITASLVFRFDAEGHNVSVHAADRVYDDGRNAPVPRSWEAKNLNFGARDGMAVATEAVAQWLLPTGTFEYWRGRPIQIDYRYGP